MADSKDKEIGQVPHLTEVTGVEKIPISAVGGLPRYVEINQIVELAQEEIEIPLPITNDEIDSLF